MKKHLLIIMLLSLSTLLSAQEAKKFLTEGKVWKCITSNYSPLHDEGDTPFTVKVVGDTICDGRTMKKLHIEYEEGVKGFYSRNVAHTRRAEGCMPTTAATRLVQTFSSST